MQQTNSSILFPAAREIRQAEERPCRGKAQAGGRSQKTGRGFLGIQSAKDANCSISSYAHAGQEEQKVNVHASHQHTLIPI